MRARWNDLPLRLRLTCLYVGLLFVLLAALCSFLYLDTRDFIISATASRLEALANSSFSHVAQPVPQGPPSRDRLQVSPGPITPTVTAETFPVSAVAAQLVRDLTWQDTTAIVVDDRGALIADGRQGADLSALPEPQPAALDRAFAGQPVNYVATVDGLDTVAVLVPVRLRGPDSDVVSVLQMSAPLGLVDRVMARQALLTLVGALTTLALAAVGGLWLTQTTLTPLRLMIAVCRRIAAGDLSQRVNLPHRRDETGQLASAFDEMVARLDATFAAQRQFVADASHELRTPLTAIGGSLDVLLMAPEGDPDTARRVLHGMRREVDRLTRLVTDLLTLTRMDARRSSNPEPGELGALAREVVESLRVLSNHREIVVDATGETRCQGEPDHFKQVFHSD